MNKSNKLIKILILMLIMYIIDFLIAPNVFKSQYPNDIGARTILYTSIIVSSIIGMIAISNNIVYYILGDILYYILIFIYHPRGVYGIGWDGIFPRVYNEEIIPFQIAIIIIFLLIVQIVISIVVKIIKVIRNR